MIGLCWGAGCFIRALRALLRNPPYVPPLVKSGSSVGALRRRRPISNPNLASRGYSVLVAAGPGWSGHDRPPRCPGSVAGASNSGRNRVEEPPAPGFSVLSGISSQLLIECGNSVSASEFVTFVCRRLAVRRQEKFPLPGKFSSNPP